MRRHWRSIVVLQAVRRWKRAGWRQHARRQRRRIPFLYAGCEEFSISVFRHRYADLCERLAQQVGAKLKSHFRDEDSLAAAVDRSELMLTLKEIGARGDVGRNDSYHARACAERLLAAFQALNDFERKHCK